MNSNVIKDNPSIVTSRLTAPVKADDKAAVKVSHTGGVRPQETNQNQAAPGENPPPGGFTKSGRNAVMVPNVNIVLDERRFPFKQSLTFEAAPERGEIYLSVKEGGTFADIIKDGYTFNGLVYIATDICSIEVLQPDRPIELNVACVLKNTSVSFSVGSGYYADSIVHETLYAPDAEWRKDAESVRFTNLYIAFKQYRNLVVLSSKAKIGPEDLVIVYFTFMNNENKKERINAFNLNVEITDICPQDF